jgi:hypothetical protein
VASTLTTTPPRRFGGRTDDVVSPLLAMEGETTLARQLIIMDAILLVFESYF